MHLNAVVLTTYRQRQLPPELRVEFRGSHGAETTGKVRREGTLEMLTSP